MSSLKETGKGVSFMVYVKKQSGQSDDALIRQFTRKVVDAGIVQQAKSRQFYLKPSQRKKQELQDARKQRRTTS